MRYDLFVQADGRLKIDGNDVVMASKNRHIYQKIYNAIMTMNPSIASGIQVTQKDQIVRAVSTYLYNHFAGDRDVNGSAIEVTAGEETHLGEGVRLQFNYRSKDLSEGELSLGLDYKLEGGALTSVSFEPSWLESVDNSRTVDVRYPVILESYSSRVPLLIRPAGALSGGTLRESFEPVYLLPGNHTGEVSIREENFALRTLSDKSIYPFSRYISAFDERSDVVLSAQFDTVDETLYSAKASMGEMCLVTRVPISIDISGTVSIAEAISATFSFEVVETLTNRPAFPLSPSRGRYYALLPRSVSPGEYVVQYTGIVSGR